MSMKIEKMIRGAMAVAIALISGAAGAVQAAAATPAAAAAPTPKAQAAAPAASNKVESAGPTIQSHRDKVSYPFGGDLARGLKRKDAQFNPGLVLSALTDSLAGKEPIMTEEEGPATLKQFTA